MQRQHVLLRLALDRDQAHRRPSDRFADRLGVARIVLVGLHVRPHKSCTHQPDLVTALANLAGPMVSAATRLHRPGRTATASALAARFGAILDHLIGFNEAQLLRVLKNYAAYYNQIRTHLSLDKNAPK